MPSADDGGLPFAAERLVVRRSGKLGPESGAGGRDLHEVPGREELDAPEAGGRPRQRGEGEDVVDPVQVGLGGDHAGGEERLDLRGEEEPVALAGPVERGDAEAVAPEEQAGAADVPERHGELAAE